MLYLVDGGIFNTVSIGDPIERCREEVESDQDIIVDIILCYTAVNEVPEWQIADTRFMTALDFYRRRKVISNYYFYKEDFLRMTRGYHDVKFRLAIQPSLDLTVGLIPVRATEDDMQNELEQGYKDGLEAVKSFLARADSDAY